MFHSDGRMDRHDKANSPFRNSVHAPNQDTEAVSFSPTFHYPMHVQSCTKETCQKIFMPSQPIFGTV